MKRIVEISSLQVIIIILLVSIAHGNPAPRVCEDSPRTVGAFGAMDRPKGPVSVSAEIRAQLPGGGSIRGLRKTRLAHSDEQIVFYDTQDGPEPFPRVAIIVKDVLAQVFEVSKFVEYGQGAIYATSCEFDLTPKQRALAIAYLLSGDGTGSAFLILTWSNTEKYTLVFRRTVGQGRLVVGSRKLELWQRTFGKDRHLESANFECEWCNHHYLITQFDWRNDKYIKTHSSRTRKAYDPAVISGRPLHVENVKKEKP